MSRHILICGAGVIANHHAKAALRLPGGAHLSVADPNPAARERFIQAFPGSQAFTSLDELLAQPREASDIVIIATPPWLHHPQTLQALRSGRPVLCEKPLAMSSSQADEMFAEATRLGLQLACCSSRFLDRPVFDEAKRRWDSGVLGKALRVRWQHRNEAARSGYEYQPESRWFLDKSRAGGGCLFDWGIYDFATLHAVLEPRALTVRSAWLGYPVRGKPLPAGTVFDVETQVVAAIDYVLADGREVRLDYERSTAAFGPWTNVHMLEGERGSLTWDWLDWEGHSLRQYSDSAGESKVEELPLPDPAGGHCMEKPLLHFVAALEGGASPVIWGDRARFNFATLNAIYRSAAEKRPVSLSLGGSLS
ncbi:Gfo/Idh/MocA family protein [Nibricoccus sp. IMCC34717]|uniref:Gfo/Idh/MocA family protein n=1 Tax=Nibricoccus sp. IMCC34717 TaxID=3034021 RepID=UPI00384E89A2